MNLETMTNSNNNGEGVLAFASLLDDYEHLIPKQGQFLQGEVFRVGNAVLYVDGGA
jgi:hypothetical protein